MNLADEVKVCSRSSSRIAREDYQRALHTYRIKNLVVRQITEVAIVVAVIEACERNRK